MKKKLVTALSILILASMTSVAYSKNYVSSDLANAIKLYKAHNYSECYLRLDNIITKDPANALAYYYKAMTAAQIGKKTEAIDNYDKALTLAPKGGNLSIYAEKGKRCLETPDKCEEQVYTSPLDKFVRSSNGARFTEEVQSQHERLRLENLKRTINKDTEIQQRDFNGFKDFSSMNTPSGSPSDADIVSAIKVLQRAGMYSLDGNQLGLSALTGFGNNNGLNMMGGNSVDSRLIQSMLMNNIGF
ncbi:MAG: hypothetical protein MJ237_01000 [bacterium]|nr:hypothetical protein [bacterium]